jgi:site-specific DNA-methyltransferase (adenine-specific)
MAEKDVRVSRRSQAVARDGAKGTVTSAFGSAGRVNHDATPFYNSRLYDELPKEEPVGDLGSAAVYRENPAPESVLDAIICRSAEQMVELPDASVHLMVTSPPYNVGKEYDADLTLAEYRAFLRRVWAETFRVLVPGGRACINVANLGRRPYVPLHAYIALDMLDLGFLMRGEILWDKGASAGSSTAWGSWLSASNPTLRDTHEYILVFSKAAFSRRNPARRKSTIARDQFLELTKSVWTFPAESATRIGHPAPFPVELPYRLIQLYTYEGEVVLDPFMGSGQTALAAQRADRRYIGYEVDPEYVKLAERRIGESAGSANSPTPRR